MINPIFIKYHIASYYIQQRLQPPSYSHVIFILKQEDPQPNRKPTENNPHRRIITLTSTQSNDYVYPTQRSRHPIAFFRDTRVAHDVNIPARCSVSYIFIGVQETRRFFPRQGKGKT